MKKEFIEEIEKADNISLDEMLTAIYKKKRTHSTWWGGGSNITLNNN